MLKAEFADIFCHDLSHLEALKKFNSIHGSNIRPKFKLNSITNTAVKNMPNEGSIYIHGLHFISDDTEREEV